MDQNYTYTLEPVTNWPISVISLILPLLLSASAVALTSLLPASENSPYLVPLLAAVTGSAWLAGLTAGFVASALAIVFAAFFLIEPIHSLAVSDLAHVLQLAIAGLAMLFFSWVVSAPQRVTHTTQRRRH
jgi:K+-sensing histidine kinase KdpD